MSQEKKDPVNNIVLLVLKNGFENYDLKSSYHASDKEFQYELTQKNSKKIDLDYNPKEDSIRILSFADSEIHDDSPSAQLWANVAKGIAENYNLNCSTGDTCLFQTYIRSVKGSLDAGLLPDLVLNRTQDIQKAVRDMQRAPKCLSKIVLSSL